MKPKKQRKGYNAPPKRYSGSGVQVNPHRSTGGKRKGKSMKVVPTEVKSGNVVRDMTQHALAIDANAKLFGTRRGVGKLLVYVDPSRKVGP
jgi:hypothetical protein